MPFERSLSGIIGQCPARAFIVNENLSQDSFDPQAIDSALNRVFGRSNTGVNLLRKEVLGRFPSTLNMETEVSTAPLASDSSENNFANMIQEIARKYRILRASIRVASSGVIAALVSSICCLSPLALALLGIASFSSAASLAMKLTSTFRPLELLAGFGLVTFVIYSQLRNQKECSLKGIQRNLGYVLVPLALMLIVYAIVNYLLGVYFLGSLSIRDLFP